VSAADTDTEQRGPATVVVAQPLKRGREEAARRWQQDVDRAVSGFAGYLGNDVATSGDGGEWTVIYRFDSKPHLMSWLASREREQVLDQAAGLFAGPASQRVLIREADTDLVTIVVSHPVKAADEGEFLSWQARVTDAERRFPGFLGAELFRPVPGVQSDWTALYRYDSDEHVDAWLESAQRRDLLAEGARFRDFELRRISSPFGSWFAPPGEGGEETGPSQWKTALSVLAGLYPTVVLLTLAISEIWGSAPLWAGLLVGNILSVSLLTWVVMPVVTRALRFWLVPEPGRPRARADLLGTVASVAFLTLAALVFWLVTTQFWHLP
jgi:antibiotic biosynthesis monooxygenase (ABM) superfamily enzyme